MSSIKLPHSSGNSMSIEAPATNPASDLALKLPATVGTAGQFLRNSSTAGTLEFGNPALTVVDKWKVTSSFSGTTDPIASNWSRVQKGGSGSEIGVPIGTGMTESSGIFTFPSTGKWWVIFKADINHSGEVDYIEAIIKTTHNNGTNWDRRSFGYGNIFNGGGSTWTSAQSDCVLDIEDLSNDKVCFRMSQEASCQTYGNDSDDNTTAMFIRLGDT